MKTVWISLPILFGLIPAFAIADPPSWAKTNTQKLEGSTLRVVCSGVGPSSDLARQDALESCRNSARQQLISNIQVKTLTIQTEKSAGFHEEITENTNYTGLKCIPERDQVEESSDSVKVWIQCRFDLKQVKTVPSGESKFTDKDSSDVSDNVKNRENLNTVSSKFQRTSAGRCISSVNSTLSIASVPACESLLVRGSKSRKIECDKNPMIIILDSNDREIIIRASGYQPKTIEMGNQRRNNDAVQIILDPL